jgi:peptidyl-prolyl cis-trans isomerase A (cyclophilin A)
MSLIKSLLATLTLSLAVQAGALAASAPRVQFTTSAGAFTVEVYPDKAPRTVANFLEYVKSGHYNGTVFHRVIENFMIQGGGFAEDLRQKPTRAAIPLESRNGLKNSVGTIAMARTADPDSATSQFFINVVDNPGLDYPRPDRHGYAVFGKVVDGMNTVQAIRKVRTTRIGPMDDVPATPVIIQSAKILAN